jgi:hypothetical protein
VEIELQEDEEFIHHTMQPSASMNKHKILKKPVHHRQASRDVEYIDLNMFDVYEDRLQEFLKTTPYIDKLLETSKQYRKFMDSLKLLASFNEELTNVLNRVRSLSKKGKQIRINKSQGQDILKKNRELRVQIKTLGNDSGVNTSINSSISSKTNNTKRVLIQERDFLLEKNDKLMFSFKKAFML